MGNPKALVENPACAGQQLIPGPLCKYQEFTHGPSMDLGSV